ncbi:MAG: vWA domain-containing protein [Planctomycetaceae bacterium]
MKRHHTSLATVTEARSGAIILLVVGFLVVLLAMAMFTVDIAYMQLTRSELRASSDAAAKAGAEALRRTKSESAARQAARDVAALNTIGGRPLLLQDSEIEVGSAQRAADGSWQFAANATPYTAVRVNAELGGASLNNPINLFFADFFGSGTFEPTRSATAAHTSVAVSLVLDRSHSMAFDMSGVDWVYPPGTPMNPHPVAFPPHPTHSRWAVLMTAVSEFMRIASSQNPPPSVGLVTWGSTITLSHYEGWLTGMTSPAVSVDLGLTTPSSDVFNKLSARANKPMLGGTNMSAGIDSGVAQLTASGVDPLASKVMILMSDGQWNTGRDPIEAAADAKANKVVIHTIAFLDKAEQTTTLQEVANITGGKFYVARNGTELEQAFTDIAQQLPVLLID